MLGAGSYSKANHPDKLARLDSEIQAFAAERTRKIIEAYNKVSALGPTDGR